MYVSIIFVFIISTLVAGNENSDTDRENVTNYENGGVSSKRDVNIIPRHNLEPWTYTSDFCRCGEIRKNSLTRIIGGTYTKSNTYPWQVLIRLFDTNSKPHNRYSSSVKCGAKQKRHRRITDGFQLFFGTVINNMYILTALADILPKDTNANVDPSQFNVILGPHEILLGGTEVFSHERHKVHEVKQIIVPDNFNENDIGLLKLCGWISFNEYVKPICLPNRNEPIEGKTATLIGWGFNATIHQIIPYFYETTVKVLNTEECRRIVPQTKFCASGINSMDSLMQGDKGGSVFYKNEEGRAVLIGISSQYFNNIDVPSQFTKVVENRNWILENTQDSTYCIG